MYKPTARIRREARSAGAHRPHRHMYIHLYGTCVLVYMYIGVCIRVYHIWIHTHIYICMCYIYIYAASCKYDGASLWSSGGSIEGMTGSWPPELAGALVSPKMESPGFGTRGRNFWALGATPVMDCFVSWIWQPGL